MRIFEVTKKIAGMILPLSPEQQIKALRPIVEKGKRLERLRKSPDWPAIEEQLETFYGEAVRKLSNPNVMSEEARLRFCHRLDLLREIREGQAKVITAGVEAQNRISLLEEKEHVRRAE